MKPHTCGYLEHSGQFWVGVSLRSNHPFLFHLPHEILLGSVAR